MVESLFWWFVGPLRFEGGLADDAPPFLAPVWGDRLFHAAIVKIHVINATQERGSNFEERVLG